jgi:3D (Asp-Asp-Asp) domain-containing protein
MHGVLVMSALHLPGAVVRGARRDWWLDRRRPVRVGDPVPVRISLYCLRGTTRRGHRVRAGIMAADPRLFPLGRYVEVYLGERWIGRFLVDDTGRRITGDRVDVWVADCDRASEFGIRRGTAVRVAAR